MLFERCAAHLAVTYAVAGTTDPEVVQAGRGTVTKEGSMLQSVSLPRAAGMRSLALIIAAASLFLAACADVGQPGQIGFWDIVFSMIIFFFWFMFIWIFITIFADIFRRNDLSGGMKAVWIFVLVILPFLGALIYMVVRPKATAQDVQMMAQADAASQAAAGVSTADELAKLQQLRDAGTIDEQQFEDLKKKLLA
jgi:hypothetical protein